MKRKHKNSFEKDAILRTLEFAISPAEMSKLMFENFGDHCGAIKKLGDVPVVNTVKDDINDCQFQEDVLTEGGVVIHKNVLEFIRMLPTISFVNIYIFVRLVY